MVNGSSELSLQEYLMKKKQVVVCQLLSFYKPLQSICCGSSSLQPQTGKNLMLDQAIH